MKTRLILICLIALGVFSVNMIQANSEDGAKQPFIGIRLDSNPLPELLNKHLRLEPGQGLVIKNVQKESPADKAGLERDDIIIGFGDKQVVSDYEEFVAAIRAAGVGTKVKLEIIHLGERKTKTVKLGALKTDLEWKYPVEPERTDSWRPGRMFRLEPGDRDWREIPWGEFPELDKDLRRQFEEHYSFQFNKNGEEYNVEIKGDPKDNEAKITITHDETEYNTTIGEIESLPKDIRKAAEDAIESARKSHRQDRTFRFYGPGFDWEDRDFFQPFRRAPFDQRFFGPNDDLFKQFEKQMRDMQKRMEEMERHMYEQKQDDLQDKDKDEHKQQEKL